MDGDVSEHDSALLTRLNALKQSNVAFASSNTYSSPTAPSESKETSEDLITRFQRLHDRTTTNGKAQLTSEALHEDTSHEDGPPSPTIEELLAEIGPEDRYTVDSTDLKEAEQLLVEAKGILPDDAQAPRPKPNVSTRDEGQSPTQFTKFHQQEQEEEAEAEASLQRILDEVGLERQSEPATLVRETTPPSLSFAPPKSFASLVFPSTPDMPLRSLNLPSTPTTAPSTHRPQAKGGGFSDEEIDSWCIICCANPTVKCFGCDGDQYCWGCWREGHVGDDVGLEEKSHVWERVVKGRTKKS